MATWRERLQPASWRGVGFMVDSDELSAGRRGQVHEYPQRDKPFVEDLGRKARKITFTAFVIGPDYMDRRDQLLKAVEEAGPGTLVHPQYGSLTVSLDPEADCRFSHTRDQGGMVTVQLAFVESGELAFPTARIDTAAKAWGQADILDGAAADDFSRGFVLDGWPDFVADGALADLQDGIAFAQRVLGGGFSTGNLSGQLSSLLHSPLSLAGRVQSLFQGFGGGQGDAWALSNASAFQPSRAVSVATPSRRREADNQAAIASLFRRASLAQATRAASVTSWPVRDDALSTRDALIGGYRAEEDVTTDDTVFRALTETRLATSRDIGERAKPLPQLRAVEPPGPVPALVLAYELYESTGREGDIVARNRIIHPGFVPRRPLLVPTR